MCYDRNFIQKISILGARFQHVLIFLPFFPPVFDYIFLYDLCNPKAVDQSQAWLRARSFSRLPVASRLTALTRTTVPCLPSSHQCWPVWNIEVRLSHSAAVSRARHISELRLSWNLVQTAAGGGRGGPWRQLSPPNTYAIACPHPAHSVTSAWAETALPGGVIFSQAPVHWTYSRLHAVNVDKWLSCTVGLNLSRRYLTAPTSALEWKRAALFKSTYGQVVPCLRALASDRSLIKAPYVPSHIFILHWDCTESAYYFMSRNFDAVSLFNGNKKCYVSNLSTRKKCCPPCLLSLFLWEYVMAWHS